MRSVEHCFIIFFFYKKIRNLYRRFPSEFAGFPNVHVAIITTLNNSRLHVAVSISLLSSTMTHVSIGIIWIIINSYQIGTAQSATRPVNKNVCTILSNTSVLIRMMIV